MGLGAGTTVRYALPEDLAAAVDFPAEPNDLSVEWDGAQAWLSGELKVPYFASTFYAQGNITRTQASKPAPTGTTGVRLTAGSSVASVSAEGLLGAYLSELAMVAAPEEPGKFGGEASLSVAVGLPLSLSLSAGGNVRCIAEADRCEGRVVGTAGWQLEPNLNQRLAAAAGRGGP